MRRYFNQYSTLFSLCNVTGSTTTNRLFNTASFTGGRSVRGGVTKNFKAGSSSKFPLHARGASSGRVRRDKTGNRFQDAEGVGKRRRQGGGRGGEGLMYGDMSELAEQQHGILAEQRAVAERRKEEMYGRPGAGWSEGTVLGGAQDSAKDDEAEFPYSQASKPVDYNTRDSSGHGLMQGKFDNLIHDAILKFADPDKDELRSHELFAIVQKEWPGVKFGPTSTDFGGVPFPALVQQCAYLNSHHGHVHFLRQVAPNGVTMGLAKFKFREAPAVDGVRQGPQPWRFHSHQLLPKKSPQRRRNPL